MYCGVPTGSPVPASVGPPDARCIVMRRAMPKSVSLATPLLVEQDILGLHIAMHHALRMRRAQPGEDLHGDLDGLFDRQRDATQQPVAQRLFHQRHDEVEQGTLLAKGMNRHDVGVVERANRLRLVAEPLDVARIGGERQAEHFDGDLTIEHGVARLIDLGHATNAKHPWSWYSPSHWPVSASACNRHVISAFVPCQLDRRYCSEAGYMCQARYVPSYH